MGKSTTCKGNHGGFLEEYFSESEAFDAAGYVKSKYGNDVVPYKCEKCSLWHLSPKNRQTPGKVCPYCEDSSGDPKIAYETKEAAQRRADIIGEEKDISLFVYECEHGEGWHLTSQEDE